MELIDHLGMTTIRFYPLRHAGIIPAPEIGHGVRKRYSPRQVKEIKATLRAAGINFKDEK